MYDLLIKNGVVIDGTGSAGYRADIAVVGQDIVAIGQFDGESKKTVDSQGLVVCPGFIDLHTHSDMSFLLDNTAQSKVRQGVTLELAGNCGGSPCAPLEGQPLKSLIEKLEEYEKPFEVTWTDFGGYLDALDKGRSTLNLAVQLGHGTIRSATVGLADRVPSVSEMDRMKNLVKESLDAGAMGFSTGLYYAPGNFARLEEVIELAEVAVSKGKLYSSHIRSEGSSDVGLFVALNEAIEIGRRTGIRVEISHVKCNGPSVWGRAEDVLELIEKARKEGIDIAGDQYPYTASSTGLTGALFPRWSLDGGRTATLKRMEDSSTRKQICRDITAMFEKRAGPHGIVISRFVPNTMFEGKSLEAISRELDCEPAEAAIRLYELGDASVISYGMNEQDVNVIARHPLISVGSDGSSLSIDGALSGGVPHPRSYGTNPRYLAQFVREQKLVTLEEAIRKMTTLPANRLQLSRRGRLAPGFAADLVTFDPETIVDTATFAKPHSYPIGIPNVVVNGTLVIEDGEFTGHTPGKIIRKSSD